MLSAEQIKKNTGIYAASFVQNGSVIGLGTGSTVYWLIEELGKRVQQGLELTIVPTSKQTAELAAKAGIAQTDLNNTNKLSLTIDGADEIDPSGQLIKGGGGALLQEKIVAAASDELIIIADSSKLVKQLGQFPLPVEVISFGYKQVQQKLLQSGFCTAVTLRLKNDNPFMTDHQHYILDCTCGKIQNAAAVHNACKKITGVVETGLFIDMANKAIIGHDNGNIETITFST